MLIELNWLKNWSSGWLW